MEENFIPDYSKYDTESLVDVFRRIDREHNPLKAQALDKELRIRLNLPPETEIDPVVINSFFNAAQGKTSRELLGKDDQMIKQGWIAGVVVGCLSFLSWGIAMLRNETFVQGVEISVYQIVDILVVFGLSYGIYMKSRVCAVILTGYFLLAKLIQLLIVVYPQNLFAILGLAVFLPFFIRAIIGTFNYQKRITPAIHIPRDNSKICPDCGKINHIANYNCKCGHVFESV